MQPSSRHLHTLWIWLVIIGIAIFAMPNINQLVHDQGQITVPTSFTSQQALRLGQREAGHPNQKTTTLTLVYHRDRGLTAGNQAQIGRQVGEIRRHRGTLQITKILDSTDTPSAAHQLRSKNRQTELVNVTVKGKDNLIHRANLLHRWGKVAGVQLHVTGANLMNDIFLNVTREGIKKTETIAAIFILIVLLLVFRSPVVPLVSLTTVGVSFIVTLSLVMNLAKYLDFPLSNFTEVFLVVVLFGIGTDYNILLYDRFKEELAKNDDASAAALQTRRTSGKTVLYSGTAVFIGFSVLGLAHFSFYRSALGVALGVGVLLSVLLTLNVFFMANLGPKMFWPGKQIKKGDRNWLWTKLSHLAIARPALMLGILMLVAAGAFVAAPTHLSFDNADEIPASTAARVGYAQVQKDFSKGMAEPTTLYIQSKHSLVTPAKLSAIDELTTKLAAEPNVAHVYSVTRPTGNRIAQLEVKNQLTTLTGQIGTMQSGLGRIAAGLGQANQQLQSANVSQKLGQLQQLANGSQRLAGGSLQLQTGIQRYVAGTGQLARGASALGQGTAGLGGAVGQLASGSQQLTNRMASVNGQLQSLTGQVSQLAAATGRPTAGISALPAVAGASVQSLQRLNAGIQALNQQVPAVTSGATALASGSQALVQQGGALTSGAGAVAGGAQQVNAGVQALNQQLPALISQVGALQQSLSRAQAGVSQVNGGLTKVSDYLSELAESPVAKRAFVPKAVLDSGKLNPAVAAYAPGDHHTTNLMIVLNIDPNSQAATKVIQRLQRDLQANVRATPLAGDRLVLGGQSSYTNDLQSLSNGDFLRTTVIMLIGIGLAMIFITRSFMEPLVIIGDLLMAYLTSMVVTQALSSWLLHQPLLSWNTPFFTFIMIIALGVDYSIFLMMRYRDKRRTRDRVPAIKQAAAEIGTVVISAVIILSGTFAAMMPSGVLTLLQVALGVIVGLMILLFTLPLVIPAYLSLTARKYQQ